MAAADLVLVHGFTQTGASWDGVRAALPAGIRVAAPDLPGHGSASERRPVDLAGVSGDLEPLLSDGVGTLAGYSMGGRIALRVALAQPERVRRLVLIGANPGLATVEARLDRRAADEALARELEADGLEAFARRWAALPLFAGQSPEVAAAAHADRLRNTPAGLAAALRGLGTGALPSLWDRLGELAQPVVLVVGERDAKFRAIAEAMAERLARAELVVVPGAGHAVHLEAPQAVAALVLRALSSSAGG